MMWWLLPTMMVTLLFIIVMGKNILQQVVTYDFIKTEEEYAQELHEATKELRLHSKIWTDDDIAELHEILIKHRTVK